jgi:ubiquinone/menaquinone biosynthesis C-methylase UbiE
MKRLLQHIGIGLIKLSLVIFCIPLFPLLLINQIDHKRKIRKNPFYKSFIVRLCEKYPLAYDTYNFIMNFPIFSNVYTVLPSLSDKVLQVGCGTGELNTYLKKKGRSDTVELYNLDTNINSLKFGQKRNAFSEYIQADICKVPIQNAFFDTIVFARCFHHIKNSKKAFRECERLLKTGGTIIIADVVSLSPSFPDHSFMMNSNFDGLIWRYNKMGFKNHVEKNLPPNLRLKSFNTVRQKSITNYNWFFPHTDGIIVVEKTAENRDNK